ncbi:hypothetical protein ACFOWA_20450 [Pedobacter lithocola]
MIQKPEALTSAQSIAGTTNLKYLDCCLSGLFAKSSEHTSQKKTLFLTSCSLTIGMMISITSWAQEVKNKQLKPQLIIQSNFEGTTRVVPIPGTKDYGASIERLAGKGAKLRNSDWDKDLIPVIKSGILEVQYTGGDSSKRYAKVVPEPGNPNNHVLKFWLDGSWTADLGLQKARVQTNLYGIKGGFKEFYQSVRVFLSNDFAVLRDYPKRITWLTLSEFWNNEWWVKEEKYGFRNGLCIGKLDPNETDLNFLLNAEDPGQKEVWRYNNTNVKVPIGKWFTMEYYFKEGNKETGRFYLAITPDGEPKKVVYDVHNFTHMTTDPAPNGLTGYNPMKLYTSPEIVAYVKSKGKTLQIYWDDFKLWKNKRPQ